MTGACAPLCHGDMPETGLDEHEGRIAVGENPRDTGTPPDYFMICSRPLFMRSRAQCSRGKLMYDNVSPMLFFTNSALSSSSRFIPQKNMQTFYHSPRIRRIPIPFIWSVLELNGRFCMGCILGPLTLVRSTRRETKTASLSLLRRAFHCSTSQKKETHQIKLPAGISLIIHSFWQAVTAVGRLEKVIV